MKRFLFLVTLSILVCGHLLPSNSGFVIVIDPGHGGRDPGAMRGAIKEKEINLAIALNFGKMIEQNMPNVKVVYTRKTDIFVPLVQRTKIANQNKANLFVSIHTNSTSAKTTTAAGADTYILGLARSDENLAVAKRENAVIKYEEDYTTTYEGFDPDSPESYIIFEFMTNHHMQQSLDVASNIQASFKQNAKRVDRGVRQAGFLVLRESSMPSILIELGFINNPTEAKFLNSTAGQQAMSLAIYNGFKKYKEDFDKVKSEAATAPKAEPIIPQNPVAKNLIEEEKLVTIPVAKNTAPKEETPKREEPATFATPTSGETEYRVQFLYSLKKLPEGSSLFKGVVPTGYTQDNGYKYTVGATTNYNEIVKIHRDVQKKFSDAFIVRIPGAEQASTTPTQAPQSQPKAETKPATPKAKQPATPPKQTVAVGAIEYRVQFLYSPTKLADNSPQFKGMEDVSFYIDNGYKYTVGATTNYNEIRRLFREVQKKFSDAFIIRMKDGKRI